MLRFIVRPRTGISATGCLELVSLRRHHFVPYAHLTFGNVCFQLAGPAI
jgi:hypothetical protein